MYVETDFLLALIKDDDWLGEAAEAVYREHREELWTSEFTLAELLMVAYREDRDVERVIANAIELLDIDGDPDTILAVATYVANHGFTPFDAIHLVKSGDETIVSSDASDDGFSDRYKLEES